MSKVLFAYNGRVEIDKSGNLYGNELNDTLVNRYKSFGSSVSFLVRTKKINDFEMVGLTPFYSEGFGIVAVPEFASILKYFRNIFRIKKLIAESVSAHDIVIARLPSLIGREAIKRAKEFHKPYLIEVVGCPWDALSNHSFIGKLYAPFAYFLLKRQVYNAPFVLYVTQFFLQSRYPNKGVNIGITDVVLNDTDELSLDKRITNLKNRLSNPGVLQIGTAAGYDVKFKGQEYVLKALRLLKDKGVIMKYIPVGKGSGKRLKEIAKSLDIEDQVDFRGQIKHSEIFNYLEQIDIYIQPSKQEGLPRAVIEAMSKGCPVIGSDAGGIPELIDSKFIFPKGDVNRLVSIIESMTISEMINQAKINFQKSKEYAKEINDKKRLEFYNLFKKSIEKIS